MKLEVHQGGSRFGADYVRHVPWLPYPKLGVAELEPPKDGKTSWDFSVIDPMTIDFLEATKGHSPILNFTTIPPRMYKSDKPSFPSSRDKDEARNPSATPGASRRAIFRVRSLSHRIC